MVDDKKTYVVMQDGAIFRDCDGDMRLFVSEKAACEWRRAHSPGATVTTLAEVVSEGTA